MASQSTSKADGRIGESRFFRCHTKDPIIRINTIASVVYLLFTTRSPSPPKEKKDKPTKRLVNGQWTGYAYRTPTTVYKLYRDSPLIDEFKSLANEDDQKEFIKKHGIAQPRR
ncbi:uncharacterized protein F4822DRAFT_413826 [Hypoxylon trugodes]|uniref:uncharacterized protein n=1 Tax=Hypoxylon trugodes TaxID=326681 RepID=UPI0021A1C98F|nr:uncharacterized protein F4822DRAFT_413826 [Hypoxylon trugodes]KAI1385657.1 hypothetical protein F4822DRAFT_413826 [Hypoxylon trugodes]